MSRRRLHTRTTCGAAAAVAAILSGATFVTIRAQGVRAGGDTTVMDEGATAFGRALANLQPRRWSDMRAGKQRFLQTWPQRSRWSDAAACVDCHFRDGRGPRPDGPRTDLSHLLRLARPSGDSDPIYGPQLRRVGHGVATPGAFSIAWEEVSDRYLSGETFALRRPRVTTSSLAYGPLDRETRVSLRVPPPVFGLGLLEAVPDDLVLASADPDDRDRDGISGRPHLVRGPSSSRPMVGRFGWKGARASLAAQSLAALANDLGVAAVDDDDLGLLVGYLRALAVPAARNADEPIVRRGAARFAAIGCDRCHRAELVTGIVSGWPELSQQVIRPYTDLLLHDMGPRLADDVVDGEARGAEWRTPPLWGLGLLPTISGGAGLLHDGRARTAEEAILWHGGEADASRERFRRLAPAARAELVAFLASL